MSGPQRMLIRAALLLIAAGILLGFGHGLMVRYNTFPVLQYRAYGTAATLSSKDGPSELIQAARHQSYTYTRMIDAHTHLIKVATVLLLLGLVYPLCSVSEQRKRVLGMTFLIGNCLFPLGVFAEIYIQGRSAQALAAIGALLVIASFAGMLWGLLNPAPHNMHSE